MSDWCVRVALIACGIMPGGGGGLLWRQFYA